MSDKMSQEDIDRLLSGGADTSAAATSEFLDETETDTIGEIGNISMGSAATTLSMLLGNKVEITTPVVKKYKDIQEILDLTRKYVTVEIKYKAGLDGTTVFALNDLDTAIIADLMMGGDGKVNNPEIGELQLSAVGEAMNQMMGTVSTTLSSMFNITIDITPPTVNLHEIGDKLDLAGDILFHPIVAVSFNLKIGDLIDSEFVQLMNVDSAKSQVARLNAVMNSMMNSTGNQSQNVQTPPPQTAKQSAPSPQPQQQRPVTVQPVQFVSFDNSPNSYGEANKNLDLLLDVKLKLTVELGRTELPIKKVLELARGSVIELEKVAGEPVELFANGKLIAKGEVVVIEDNFGLRITSIISPDSRIKNI